MAVDVLVPAPGGLDLVDDPGEVGPHPPGVGGAETQAGDGFALARIAARDDIHEATPWSAIEGGHVVPDRSWSK